MSVGESKRTQRDFDVNRRDLLRLTGVVAAGAAPAPLAPGVARAQAPKRGGTINIRAWDPPHFDPHLCTQNLAKRREIVYEIQKYLAKQQYYVQMPSPTHVAVWDGALKNYAPNHGYDYGGRLMAAWLDR